MTKRTTAQRLQQTLVGPSSRVAAALIHRLPAGVQVLGGGGRPVTVDGNTLDPAVQMLLAGQNAAGLRTLGIIGDPVGTRARAREVCALFGGPDVAVPTEEVTIAGPEGPIPARLYRSAEPDAALLVFFHGGGYVFGDLDTHDPLCRVLCRDVGVSVLAVDYRLAPEHPAPAAVDDAYAAYLWALAHSAELGVSSGRVAVGGDSAGGGLAASVSRLARDAGVAVPALQLLLYPYVAMDIPTRSRTLFADGFLLTEADQVWFASQYVGGSGLDSVDPRVSPLLAEDLSALPPALVVTAGFDPLRDQGRAYHAALRAAGTPSELVELPTMMHAFANFLALGGGVTAALGDITDALRLQLGSVRPVL